MSNCEQGYGMYATWYRGDSGMHHHQMGQLYHHGPPMIKTEAGINSDCMMAVDYAPPIKKAGASSAFVWSGGGVGGGQEQVAAQPAAVPTGTTGGGGAQGLAHWMSVMAEHMGGGHHDPSHYALPPWNNGAVDHCQQKDGLEYATWSRPRGTMAIKQGYEAKMSTGEGTVSSHQKVDDRLGHHQSMSQMLYGAGLGPGRSGSSSSSPVGATNNSLLVVPQPLGKGPTKLQPLHAHARKYHCKMCPQMPQDPQSWLQIEDGFRNFPRCLGAIDGKHIVIQSPTQSGSEYYNYKRSFSIVLLALVDSNYNFIFAEIGSQGRISDGGVFRNSKLWQRICSNDLNFPMPRPLPGRTRDVPYVFLGDGAFALTTHMMKPYPGSHNERTPKRIFNKKLSSSRVVVENVFGILASKFRIFRKPILLDPEKTTIVTMTCVLLHNFLRKSSTSSAIYTPPGLIDVYNSNDELVVPGSWRNENEDTRHAIRPLQQIPRRPAQDANQIREEFTSYFFSTYNNNNN